LQSLALVRYSGDVGVVTWKRSGTSPELILPPQLFFSQDGSPYTEVGTLQRIDGGWQYSGFAPLSGQRGYLRVRGWTAAGLIENTLQFGDESEGIEGIFVGSFE
jgi:hypothetical protein